MDKEIPKNDAGVLERVIQELKSSRCGGADQKYSNPEGLWIVYSLHVMEEKAFRISNEKQEEHGTPHSRPSDTRLWESKHYLLRGLQRKQYPQMRIPLQSKKTKRTLVKEGEEAEYSR